jgi:hypothetical protein
MRVNTRNLCAGFHAINPANPTQDLIRRLRFFAEDVYQNFKITPFSPFVYGMARAQLA